MDIFQISLGEFDVTQAAARQPQGMKIAVAWERLWDVHGASVRKSMSCRSLTVPLEEWDRRTIPGTGCQLSLRNFSNDIS